MVPHTFPLCISYMLYQITGLKNHKVKLLAFPLVSFLSEEHCQCGFMYQLDQGKTL